MTLDIVWRRAWAITLLALGFAAGCAASAPPSASPTPSIFPSTATAAASDASRPPGALLAVNGQGRYAAELGTYVYRGAGSDAPWLPARSLDAVSAPARGRLTVRLSDGRPIAAWSARVAAAADEQGVAARGLAEQSDGARLTAEIELPAPGPGSWVLAVDLDYGDGSGSAVYFWRLEVR